MQESGSWFVKREGKIRGPFPPDTLRLMAQKGIIDNETLVSSDKRLFLRASQVEWLASMLPGADVRTIEILEKDEDSAPVLLEKDTDIPPPYDLPSDLGEQDSISRRSIWDKRESSKASTVFCPDCGNEVSKRARMCPHCGLPFPQKKHYIRPKRLRTLDSYQRRTFISGSNAGKKALIGLAGSIILFIGIFTPIVSVPIIGTLNYFQNGKGDGVIIMVLALVSVLLIIMGRYRGLWFTGIGSFGVLIFTFINFQVRMSQAKSAMERDLADNPFRGLGELALQSVQLQWGWAILVVGAALVITAAAMKEEQTDTYG
jgi:hypothetical protein